MNELPDLQRDALTMRYIQQDEYETIAALLGKTPPQVRALCHKAISTLRGLFIEGFVVPNRKGASHVEDRRAHDPGSVGTSLSG
jgi:hypothetical protein